MAGGGQISAALSLRDGSLGRFFAPEKLKFFLRLVFGLDGFAVPPALRASKQG